MMGSRLSATALLLFSLGFLRICPARAEEVLGKQYFPVTQAQKMPSIVVHDDKGREVLLRDLLREAPPDGGILFTFWARWCAPCMKELPALAAFAGAQKKVQVILIAEETSSAETLKATLMRRGADQLPLYSDASGDAARLLQLPGLPGAILVSADGRLVGKFLGPVDWQTPETQAFVTSRF